MTTVETHDFDADERLYVAALSEARVRNRTALFDALATAGLTTVTVSFDGCGDSGQIESIDAKMGDDPTDVPDGAVTIAKPQAWGSTTLADTTGSPTDLLEHLAYDCLNQAHGGWENNDGAYGEFTFDVAARTITLDYNERYTATDYSQHEF